MWMFSFGVCPGGSEVKASACNAGDLGVPSLDPEDPLGKEMVIHSSILAWRIPWTEESGGLQSAGSQRVRHDSATSLSSFLSFFSFQSEGIYLRMTYTEIQARQRQY